MKNQLRNKYSAILILTALSFLLVIAFQKSGSVVSRTNAPVSLKDEKAIEHLKETDGYDSLQEAMTAARYKIEHDGETLSAENPANQMSARFDKNGQLQLSGATKDSRWQTAWKLKSFGRGENQSAVGGGIWRSIENRTELRREEIGLTEYFENRADGLEQGFILDAKPAGDENLSLILQTSGGLRGHASADGQKIVLSDATGAEVLDYDKLKVWDAAGKDLTARMTTDETGEIRFEVKDANAVYPLTIDPTFIQRQKLTASDGTSFDYFGRSVAISGDTAVVGELISNTNRGAVHIFVRNGTNWTQQTKLVAADGQSTDYFGRSVAISGDTIIIGAPNNGNSNQGTAYIFVRNGATWTAQEKLVAADRAADDKFGSYVKMSGDTIIIGASDDDVGANADQGSAYIFVRNGGAWTQQAKLTANDGEANDSFGASVTIAGSTVIIGATGNNSGRGAAYVFTRTGTTWTQQAKLTASDGAISDHFGGGVDIVNTLSGTFAVIGAPEDNIAGTNGQGSAYVFTRNGTTWSQTQKLISADSNFNARFGSSIAITPISGSRIVIGAYGASGSGSVYIFARVNSVWTQQQKLTANDNGTSINRFGISVDISGDTIITGASDARIGENISQGAAYIFKLGGSSPFDFDGDGKTDIGIFRPAPGEWWYLRSSDGGNRAFQFGQSTDRIVPADYTGDGKTDVAFYRPSTGTWFILRSEDNSFYSFPFGASGDIAVPADYDGDGKTDPAIFRPGNATWYIQRSTDNGTTIVGFGFATDKPVTSDYDGDGKSDIAIFRPNGANGAEWWYLRSSDGSNRVFQFGISTDKPVQGDYTGDGKADIAFFRPSNGTWFILRSEDSSFFSFPFGANGDVPAAGDYDGDGKTDPSVFRPSNSTWYLNQSTAGVAIVGFGITGDKPIPSAFVP